MKRVASLDSLRGVAAAVVVLHHSALVYSSRLASQSPPWSGQGWRDVWAWVDYTPLRVFISGEQAVLVFFALSGFVLALTFKQTEGWKYSSYVIKRFCRIFLPFASAILVSAILFQVAQPHLIPTLSYWFNYKSWASQISPDLIIGHLVMADAKNFQTLDNVMWSLVHELRISLIFPVIALGVKAHPRTVVLACTAISAGAVYVEHLLPVTLMFDPFQTLKYLYLFAGGAALAFNSESVRCAFDKLPNPARVALWLGALVFVTWPAHERLALFINGYSAILLVALCFADPTASKQLSAPVPAWLGRVSYSLYLLHVPILLFVIHIGYDVAPLWVLISLAALVSLACAELSYRFIEYPAVQLGRRLIGVKA